MKKTLITLIASVSFAGAAVAGDNLRAQYNDYLNSLGDPTAMTFESWKTTNGFAKQSMDSRGSLTRADQAYIRFSNAYGDATAPSFQEWKSSQSADSDVQVVESKHR